MRAAEVDGDYEWETGRVITETLRDHDRTAQDSPAVAGPVPRAVRLGRDAGRGRRGGDRARGDRDDRLADARHRPVDAGDPGGAAPPPLRPQARRRRLLRPAASRRGRRMRYAVGLDFGTESGRAVLVDLATGAELGTAIHEYANGVIDRRLPAPDDDVVLEPDWALAGPRRLHRDDPGDGPAPPRRDGRRPGRRRRARDRLHRLHDAADDRRRHAALPAAGAPPRAARLGEALEAPRRAARGGPDQRDRAPPAGSRGCRATAAGSRRSGSTRRASRSSTRRRRSTGPRTA